MEVASQSCPRRMLEPGSWDREAGLDSWSSEARREGEQVPFCSFCGSLHPARFLELIREGWTVGPTDKDYKAYLDGLNREHAKFYFQHLSEPQMREFIALLNLNRMKVGHPGHFYVLPFFMRVGPVDV